MWWFRVACVTPSWIVVSSRCRGSPFRMWGAGVPMSAHVGECVLNSNALLRCNDERALYYTNQKFIFLALDLCVLAYIPWTPLDSGHPKQATVKCGTERQEGDRVATGKRQDGDRKTAGKRQESGRKASGNDRQAKGRRQGSCGRRATGWEQGGDKLATGWRQGSNRKQDIATGYATARRKEDNRRATGLAATGERQGSDRRERQESDRRATGERQEGGRVVSCDRKAAGRRQGCNSRVTGLLRRTRETK